MLYLITIESTNTIKVGFTSNLDSRAKAYATTNPEFHGFQDVCNGSRVDEKIIHCFFDGNDSFNQINNTEWYRCANRETFDDIVSSGLRGIKARINKETNEIFQYDDESEEISEEEFAANFSATFAKRVAEDNSYCNVRKREIKEDIMEAAKAGRNHIRTSISRSSGEPVVKWLRSLGFEVLCYSRPYVGYPKMDSIQWERGNGTAYIYWN